MDAQKVHKKHYLALAFYVPSDGTSDSTSDSTNDGTSKKNKECNCMGIIRQRKSNN